MKMKSICILALPVEAVWETMRDRLPELANLIDDIDSVTLISKSTGPADVMSIVNKWKSRPKMPALIANHLPKEITTWTDRAEWRTSDKLCEWTIEPHAFTEQIKCSGTTRYESAMGGAGTRVTFDGEFSFSPAGLPIPAGLRLTTAKAVESLLTSLVPKNFMKLGDAVRRLHV